MGPGFTLNFVSVRKAVQNSPEPELIFGVVCVYSVHIYIV